MRASLVVLGAGLVVVACGGKDHSDPAGSGAVGSGGSASTGASGGAAGSGKGGTGSGASGSSNAGKSGGAGASGSAGSGGSAGADSPFEACGSVVDCSGVLCVDPENTECTSGGCLDDRRVSLVDFYCTKECATDADCPNDFVCAETNVAGGLTGSYCVRYLPACGNEIQDPDEACDDGNTAGGDGCSADCLSDETCGNDFVDPGEVCDDGENEDGDGCSANCLSDETCGNDVLDASEDCDDGNTTGEDGCEADCTVTGCGNQHPTFPEACDDEASGCDSQCRIVPVDGIAELARYPDDKGLSYPTLMAGAGEDGRLFVSWMAPPFTPATRSVLVSTDAGEHFVSRRDATVSESASLPPDALLRGITGNELVLWYPYYSELRFRRSSDLGARWGALETVAVPTLQSITGTDLVAAGDDWYFVWTASSGTGSTKQTYLMQSPDAGRTWGDPVIVSEVDTATGCSELSVNAEVDGHLVVHACTGVFYRDNALDTFHAATTDAEYPIDWLNMRGIVEVGAGKWLAPDGLGYWVTEDHFHSWSYVTLGPAWNGTRVALKDATGALWWGWGGTVVQESMNSEIDLVRSTDGGENWDPIVQVATFAGHQSVPWGMTSGAAGIYVYWGILEDGADTSEEGLRVTHSEDAGATWSPPITLSQPENYAGPAFSFFVGGDDSVHAIWTERPKTASTEFFVRHTRLTP